MPKLYRRTWERQKWGRAGQITTVYTAKSGLAKIEGASFEAPVSKLLPVSGHAWSAADVGRKIRIEIGTSNTQADRYNGLYIIDSFDTNDNSVSLRFNHNVEGNPGSPARFFEDSPAGASPIHYNWYMPEACVFQADLAGDIEPWFPGSYITIEKCTAGLSDNNKGQWVISHRIDSQTVILCKSNIYIPVEYDRNLAVKLDEYLPFALDTNLAWYVSDRVAFCGPDATCIHIQNLIDAGWQVWQQRGHHATKCLTQDIVLRSNGEDNSNYYGGSQQKVMYLRFVTWMRGGRAASNYGKPAYRWATSIALYQHWDVTLTNGSPGDGAAGLRDANYSNTTYGYAANPNPAVFTDIDGALAYYQTDLGSMGLRGLPHDQEHWDWAFFGDRDEVIWYDNRTGSWNSNNAFNATAGSPCHLYAYGILKSVGTIPHVIEITGPVPSGNNVAIPIGDVDPTTLNPPYAVGDNITVMGYKTSSPDTVPISATAREFIETTTIVAFDQTPGNRKIMVSSLLGTYGNGPDAIKGHAGEDPFPTYIYVWNQNVFMHNMSRYAHSVGRDYDASRYSITVDPYQAVGLTDVDPNRTTGRYALSPMIMRSSSRGELRGRLRYLWRGSTRLVTGTRYVARDGSVYVSITPIYDGDTIVIGPMSKALAGVAD